VAVICSDFIVGLRLWHGSLNRVIPGLLWSLYWRSRLRLPLRTCSNIASTRESLALSLAAFEIRPVFGWKTYIFLFTLFNPKLENASLVLDR